jgi:hypothetical protein
MDVSTGIGAIRDQCPGGITARDTQDVQVAPTTIETSGQGFSLARNR